MSNKKKFALKYLGYFFIGFLSLVLIMVATFWVGAEVSLDRSFAHSEEVEKLPFFSPDASDGLVRIATKQGNFRARVAGFGKDEERPLVILLHGFPVTSAMWLDLIPPLVEAGYSVVAFDQRGYSPEVRPREVEQYAVAHMVSDVYAVADAAGFNRFHLVGHDWGAGVGWNVVLANRGRVISWTPLSIAHPAAFGAALQNDPDQQSRSGYFELFIAPWIPETLFSFNDFWFLKKVFAKMPKEKIDEYIDVFSEPGALTAALNWYRANLSDLSMKTEAESMDVMVPTLFIWGNMDSAVGRRGTELMADYMKGPYSIIELNAGHWLLSEAPQQIINPILDHLQVSEAKLTNTQ